MKKLYFLLLISLCSKSISAQTYYPMLDSVNHWQTLRNFIPVRLQNPNTANSPCTYPVNYINTLEQYTTQDTVINALTYKVVDAIADQVPVSCNFGFIREDTSAKKVYFKDNLGNAEILLYDFSMQVGNTISLNFFSSGGYFQSGTFTLDSIRTIHINSGFRRIFYLNNHASIGSQTLPWVESVGCLYNPFYTYFSNSYGDYQFMSCNEFQHNAAEFLSCFDHLSKVYYDSCAYNSAILNSCFDVHDTCNYSNVCGSINELKSIASMDVFPNPSSGKTTVSLDIKQSNDFKLIVWDISGKKVLKEIPLGRMQEGKKDIDLDLTSLTNGFYLVELKAGEGSVYKKLFIEK